MNGRGMDSRVPDATGTRLVREIDEPFLEHANANRLLSIRRKAKGICQLGKLSHALSCRNIAIALTDSKAGI